ncbi:MAG: DUF4832 domain-containing protein [Firmicutes bacterium]|nr:DUF4832 domain-containing protein [Bacillota bacterium]
MQYALRHMGYRLVPVQVSFPTQLAPGDTFELHHTRENRGLGRLYRPYRLGLFLLAEDRVAWSAIYDDSSFTDLTMGNVVPMRSEFTLPDDIMEGTYRLALALVDEQGTPAIQLAVAGHEGSMLMVAGPGSTRSLAVHGG